MLKKSTYSLLCALAVSGLAVGSAHAAGTSTWTGGGDGTSWTDAANWDAIPSFDGTTDVVFDDNSLPSGGAALSLDGDKTIHSITLNNDQNPLTLDPAGGTLTLTGGSLIAGNSDTGNAASTVNMLNPDINLGADGTFDDHSYKQALRVNGAIGETGGSRSLTIDTDGYKRRAYFTGDNTYTGATTITGSGSTTLAGATQSSGVTVDGGTIALRTSDALGSGAFTLNNAHYHVGGVDKTITNPTFMSGTFEIAAIGQTEANQLPVSSGTRGRAQFTFANPVTLTSDVTIEGGSYYKSSAGPVFAGGFTGGHSLTFSGDDYAKITGASTYTGGTLITGGGFVVTADGGLGTGDVTVDTPSLSNQATLDLETAHAIDTAATLTLADGWNLDLNFTGTQYVNELFINGTAQSPGTTIDSSYTDPGSSYHPISGDGAITVVPVPEPASLALLGLGGGLMMLRRRRGASEA